MNKLKKSKLKLESNKLGFTIKPSTYPAPDGFDELNEYEIAFLTALSEYLPQANLSPKDITLTRLSDKTFNVSAPHCYVGKIKLRPGSRPTRYAVNKQSRARAICVVNSEEEAKALIEKGEGDYIEVRPASPPSLSMQYSTRADTVKWLYTSEIQECISQIPRWINYINHCQNELNEILKE